MVNFNDKKSYKVKYIKRHSPEDDYIYYNNYYDKTNEKHYDNNYHSHHKNKSNEKKQVNDTIIIEAILKIVLSFFK